MTHAKRIEDARKRVAAAKPPGQRPSRGRLLLPTLALVLGGVVAGAVLWGQSSGEQETFAVHAADPGPIHVHGLGVNPADDSLFIATHTGLFRVAKASRKAERVGDRYQDTMGFSVVGPDRFIGSGHPDARERLPPLLGLIASDDAGKTWEPISLLGEADFHVLRSAGSRVYGYDASHERLLVSDDRGRSWEELAKPGRVVDFVPDPSNPTRLVVTAAGGGQGMYASIHRGRSWTRLNDTVGLVAWPIPQRLYVVTDGGQVLVSTDGGRTLAERGEIGGQPAALLGRPEGDLYVALHDGTIKRSTDGGETWAVRSRP